MNLDVVRADALIMQKAAVFEPEAQRRVDHIAFSCQMPVPIFLDSVHFQTIQHDLVDTVRQRGEGLPATVLNMFELQSLTFSVFCGFVFS